jgi:hypothetical protein
MKRIATLVITAMILSACATGKSYSTRPDLQDDPGSKIELVFKISVHDAYPLLRDMTAACFGLKNIRVSGDKPGADGRGGEITIATIPGILKSRIIATTKLDPTDDNGTRTTIYYFGDDTPKGLVSKYQRWLSGGSKSCSE